MRNPFRKRFPLLRQLDAMDCGPTCLRMISAYYGKSYSLEQLREITYFSRTGVSLFAVKKAAEKIGFETLAGRTVFQKLRDVGSPFIAHWNYDHFIVVYKIKGNTVYTADPGGGYVKYTEEEFTKYWATEDTMNDLPAGIILALEPGDTYDDFQPTANKEEYNRGLRHIFSYMKKHTRLIVQMVLSLLAISIMQLATPFLTQVLVDIGINQSNFKFINLILLGQLFLFAGRMGIDFTRRWAQLHLSTHINITMVSDFLSKLMRLPLSFYTTKMTGDILKRIEDHQRVEMFLSSSTLNIFFSAFSIVIFGAVLFIYSIPIFLVFLGFSIGYLVYVLLFLRKRAELDYKRFNQLANTQDTLMESIQGMAEIKLNNSQNRVKSRWQEVQALLYGVNVSSNKLAQYQEGGSMMINELKNILITFMAATAVINGDITFGMMLSIMFIIGQLNVPINDIINIVREWQDAKLSLERIGEIKNLKEEDQEAVEYKTISEPVDIQLNQVGFQYEDEDSPWVLKNLNIHIPKGKVTAIVGVSGSGKTTLMKLLLKYYQPTEGSISLGDTPIAQARTQEWRNICGVVMQDNYIFSDTILQNITMTDEEPDMQRVFQALTIANIVDFVNSMPMGINTKIGATGVGLSGGQQQRILIARAVYKNPKYIFLDEATSALDANNEKVIVNNLNEFFEGRTVVIVAHRLSTVKNADQIIVLDEGQVVEIGDHLNLVKSQGKYYQLIQNQLEL